LKLTHGTHVALTFTISDAETAEVLDDAHATRPLHFTHGARQMLRAVERGIEGLAAGDTFDLVIPEQDAYGPRSDQVMQKVEIATLPPGIQPGMVIELGIPGMEGLLPPVVFHVKDVRDGIAHLDGNHPMAGRSLRFVGAILQLLPGAS
jgi:FKBP-type peptidyl-prolyl cis-trans isomerase SlyD